MYKIQAQEKKLIAFVRI